MKLRISILLVILSLLAGCNKEESLVPTYADVDWYVIQDDPSNPLKHLIYEVYKTTGVSIFYSDILGKQFRGYDVNGDSVIFTKTININYAIDNASIRQAYELSESEKDIQNGVEFLRDRVIPRLIDHTRPKGFLLVDRLILCYGDRGEYTGSVLRAFDATVVGRLKEICVMTEDELEYMAAEILAPGLAYYLYVEKKNELEAFYKLSNLQTTSRGSIAMYEQQVSAGEFEIEQREIPWEMPPYFGFLDINRDDYWVLEGDSWDYYSCPTQRKDIENYVIKVLYGDDVAFEAEFGKSELCMKKYEIMKDIVAKLLDRKNNENN